MAPSVVDLGSFGVEEVEELVSVLGFWLEFGLEPLLEVQYFLLLRNIREKGVGENLIAILCLRHAL